MLGVKIVVLLMVISFVWNILVKSVIRGMSPTEKAEFLQKIAESKSPWWFALNGFLILAWLLGLIYTAVYFLFYIF